MRFAKFMGVYLLVSLMVFSVKLTTPPTEWQVIVIIELLVALVTLQLLSYFEKK